MCHESEFVKVCRNPVVQLKLAELRNEATPCYRFRQLIREIYFLLISEELAGIALRKGTVRTPMGEDAEAYFPAENVSFVPIIRAGNGGFDGGSMAMPSASAYHIGIERNEKTLQVVTYYEKRPGANRLSGRFIITDVMLATGNSLVAAIGHITDKWGVPATGVRFVGVVAAPEGIAQVRQKYPTVSIRVAAIDRCLNKTGYILPGLGDAGDRQYGT